MKQRIQARLSTKPTPLRLLLNVLPFPVAKLVVGIGQNREDAIEIGRRQMTIIFATITFQDLEKFGEYLPLYFGRQRQKQIRVN